MSWCLLFEVDVIGCALRKCFSLRECPPIMNSIYEEFSEVAPQSISKMQKVEKSNVKVPEEVLSMGKYPNEGQYDGIAPSTKK